MASAKDRYEASRFLAARFKSGKWRGSGVTAVVQPSAGWIAERRTRLMEAKKN